MRVLENMAMRILGPKLEEIAGGWRSYAKRMGETRSAYNILIGKPQVKRPLIRPKHGWEIILE
jgi:hypothetical protein